MKLARRQAPVLTDAIGAGEVRYLEGSHGNSQAPWMLVVKMLVQGTL